MNEDSPFQGVTVLSSVRCRRVRNGDSAFAQTGSHLLRPVPLFGSEDGRLEAELKARAERFAQLSHPKEVQRCPTPFQYLHNALLQQMGRACWFALNIERFLNLPHAQHNSLVWCRGKEHSLESRLQPNQSGKLCSWMLHL
jgi:hypothetical protein